MVSLDRVGQKVRIKGALRKTAAVCIDAVLAALSLIVAIFLRTGNFDSPATMEVLETAVPAFTFIAIVNFLAIGLYGNVWRYASVPDLVAIAKAVTLAIVMFVVFMFFVTRAEALPRSTPLIQWFVLVFMLGGVRLGRRLNHKRRIGRVRIKQGGRIPVLLVGGGEATFRFLQALASDPASPYAPVGVLVSDRHYLGRKICDTPVLGECDALERVIKELKAQDQTPRHLILAEPASTIGAALTQDLVRVGEEMGLVVSRLPSPTELRRPQASVFDLRPVELVDLLSRPQVALDRGQVGRLIGGKRVLVTGAGGTIGSELVVQIAALKPAELILVEFSEYNLYSIDMTLREQFPSIPRFLHLCNIRERERVMQIFERHRPELVFHAAALKHVPMVEINPCEGILTNVIGTRNVADAVRRHGALAMVQVSTDKAVNPTSVMGAAKRIAELYCQALDLSGQGNPRATRFMAVRFGNVLGSSGSLIPLFERQLKAGGPLTVTHPDIERFFMTVREAVELILQGSAHGYEGAGGIGEIFVLDMGEPVKIIDIAKRMIRLAGLVPDEDVKIEIVGLRPGEKLFEELFDHAETRLPARTPGIFGARPVPVALDRLNRICDRMEQAAYVGDGPAVRRLIAEILPSYIPPSDTAARPADVVAQAPLARTGQDVPHGKGIGYAT